MSDILETILARRRERLARCPGEIETGESEEALMERFFAVAETDWPLVDDLRKGPRPAVIAEFKRASPTAGPIAAHADPAWVARRYVEAGAAAISVLTEPDFFHGSLDDLAAVRAGAPSVSILRKDFLWTAEDYFVSRAAGADAVLVIARAVPPSEELIQRLCLAHMLGLEPLVEVHSEAECDRAVEARAKVIGVNHRDLATFEIDLSLTGRLRRRVPSGVLLVAESGLRTPDDVKRVRDDGADAILVGETLMRDADPGAALERLMSGVW